MNNQNDINEPNDPFEKEFQSLMKDLKSTVSYSKPSEERLQKRIQIVLEENRKLEDERKQRAISFKFGLVIDNLKSALLNLTAWGRPPVLAVRLVLAFITILVVGISYYLITQESKQKRIYITKKKEVISDTAEKKKIIIITPEEEKYKNIVRLIQIDTILPKPMSFVTSNQLTLPERINILKETLENNEIKIASDKNNKIITEWFTIKTNQTIAEYKSRLTFKTIEADTSRIYISEEKIYLKKDEKIDKEISKLIYKKILRAIKKK